MAKFKNSITGPNTWVQQAYGFNLDVGDSYIRHHFTYDNNDYYADREGGVCKWYDSRWNRCDYDHSMPGEIVTACKLWAKSKFQALPLHEFLLLTLGDL